MSGNVVVCLTTLVSGVSLLLLGHKLGGGLLTAFGCLLIMIAGPFDRMEKSK